MADFLLWMRCHCILQSCFQSQVGGHHSRASSPVVQSIEGWCFRSNRGLWWCHLTLYWQPGRQHAQCACQLLVAVRQIWRHWSKGPSGPSGSGSEPYLQLHSSCIHIHHPYRDSSHLSSSELLHRSDESGSDTLQPSTTTIQMNNNWTTWAHNEETRRQAYKDEQKNWTKVNNIAQDTWAADRTRGKETVCHEEC